VDGLTDRVAGRLETGIKKIRNWIRSLIQLGIYELRPIRWVGSWKNKLRCWRLWMA